MKKTKNIGFTIVELLIVIVVIGILAALVLNSFSGVQAKSRDIERVTDTKALAKQLDAFHAEKGYYPRIDRFSPANIDDTRANLIKGTDSAMYIAPGSSQSKSSYIGYVGGMTTAQYSYKSWMSNGTQCDNATVAPDESVCCRFSVWYVVEQTGVVTETKGLVGC